MTDADPGRLPHAAAASAIRVVDGAARLDAVRGLLRRYAAELRDVHGVAVPDDALNAELAGLPGAFAGPGGSLLLAIDGAERAMGCAGVRPWAPGSCELKRLFVAAEARGTGAGRALLGAAVGFGAAAGYRRMLLDTLPGMAAAAALYRQAGFIEVPAYAPATLPGLRYFERPLP